MACGAVNLETIVSFRTFTMYSTLAEYGAAGLITGTRRMQHMHAVVNTR